MTANGERNQLLAEIATNPDNSTLRLAFADWLDEQPTTRTCPKCGGKGHHYNPPYGAFRPDDCSRCNRSGVVPDTSDADRAEFVRLQCRFVDPSHRPHLNWMHACESPSCVICPPARREAELLDAHPEWSRCPCPSMADRQWGPSDPRGCRPACPTCGGTGDLFVVSGVSGASKHRTVTFARGFPDAVTCTLEELGEVTTRHETRYSDSSFYDEVCVHCDATDAVGSTALRGPCKARFVPTPWAVEVVKQTPVVRFRLTDQTPHHRDAAIRGPFTVGLVWDWSSAHVQYFLIREMAASHPDNVANTPGVDAWWVEFQTEAEARDALALSAGRLVRRHAYKERT